MSADCFTWHPDQNDVYDGNVCGSMSLDGPPSKFDKDTPYSFTMKGTPKDHLVLEAVTQLGENPITQWGRLTRSSDVTNFNIQGGRLWYRSTGADLVIGNPLSEAVRSVIITVTDQFFLESRAITGVNHQADDASPGTQINIRENGVCSMLANDFSGGFDVTIADKGVLEVDANDISLSYGRFEVSSTGRDGGYSLDLTAFRSQSGAPNEMTLSGISINCRSSSKARLRAKSLTLSNTNVHAEVNAAVRVRCNAFTAGSSSFVSPVFILAQGAATFTFSNDDGEQKFPIDYDNKEYPEGMFNFITINGINTGSYRFRATNNADASQQYSAFMSKQYFAINGKPFNGRPTNGYTIADYTYDGTYMSVGVVRV